MDYEKRYKEALEQAKKELAQSGPNSDSARQILRFFPELTESEDERIRKEILIYIGAKQDIDLETHNRWCTYLERQKEQKSVKYELKDAFKYYTDAGITVSCGDIVAKPKEQKPAEWNEEDERMFSRCVKSIESSKQFADSDTFKEAKDKEIDWLENRLKSLRPSWKPSEEQMEAVKHAYNSFPDYCPTKLGLKSLYEHLKKL